MNELENIEKNQLNNYILAVKDIITNNTSNLVFSDISSLAARPPLDSMDVIKNKLLEIGKKNNLLINSEKIDLILDTYRSKLIDDLSFINDYRNKEIFKDVDSFKPVRSVDIIKITKKRLNEIDKVIVGNVKKIIKGDVSKCLITNYSNMYLDYIESSSLTKSLNYFFNKEYPKNLIDGIELKILVKDTTLINGVKEQGERYLFIKNNSKFDEL